MIVDQVLLHNKDRTALSFEGEVLTFGQLEHLIKVRAIHLCGPITTFILAHTDPIKFVVDFLAVAYLGKEVVVGDSLDKNSSIEGIKIEDWELKSEMAKTAQGIVKNSKAFKFGVLSSGRDGTPKVIWRQNDEWESAFSHQSGVFKIPAQNRLFVLNALSYSANLNSALHTLWNGGEVCFTSLKNAKDWDKEIVSKSIDSIFLVPSHWKLLNFETYQNSKVKSCLSAGEKLDIDTAKDILRIFPSCSLTEYYGASELGHISYQQNEDIINYPVSVGKAFPGVCLQIKDQKIYVDSPYIAQGYKEVGTVNDLGYLENDRLVLLGRAGRMFNKRGLNVYAQEIELVVQLHLKVEQAVLVKTRNHKLCLLYKLSNEETLLDKKDLWSFLEEHLAKNKHPHFLQEVESFPLTTAGKIDFQELKRTYESPELFIAV